MKRSEMESVATWASLPEELLLTIARFDGWRCSGPMARSSQHMLHLFTSREVLREILLTIQHGDLVLLHWLLLSVPRSLLSGNTLFMGEAPDLSQSLLLTMPGFLTGGALAQQLYGRVWESDIDMFVEATAKWKKRKQILLQYQFFDVVPVHGMESERCIEYFDLSVVQQGYQLQQGGELYCTPLALYSSQWKEVVVLPTPECIDYTVPFTGERITSVSIWRYIDRHTRDCVAKCPYHECERCDAYVEGVGERRFRPWRDRARKYASRFPDFAFVYCKPPRSKGLPFHYSPLLNEVLHPVADLIYSVGEEEEEETASFIQLMDL
jgi:hypothetical protein